MASYFTNIYELIEFFGLLLLVFLLGCFATISAAGYFIFKYLDFSSMLYRKSQFKFKSVCFSELLKENMNFSSLKSSNVVESCRFFNVLLAFLFKEWRDTATVHKWVVKKINVEIEELLETKAAKRLLHSITIHDFNLGENSPVIHGVSIKEPCAFSSSVLPDLVVVDVELEYDGGFQLAVDVDLLFGASAFVSIYAKHLKGLVRLQFNRKPCTHWSISFVGEPIIDIQIDTNLLSRPLPPLGSLVLNQVYRTVRRKHTFPNCKIRYTPFNAFWFDQCDSTDEENIPPSCRKIDVTIVACSRLLLPHNIHNRKVLGTSGVVYATISLSNLSCVEVQFASTEIRKSNFLLTTIADAFSEVEQRGKYLRESDRKDNEQEVPEEKPEDSEKLPSTSEVTPPSVLPEIVVSPDSPQIVAPARAESNKEEALEQESDAAEEAESNGTRPSYMMVTRNFSAVLCEDTNGWPDSPTRVHVESVIWSKSSNMKHTISEGDRILSINGHTIHSLSQTIALINQIRSEKKRFFFKVQRKRSRAASMRSQSSQRSHDSFYSPPRPPSFPSDSDDESLPDDTESDFTDLDTDEHESYAFEEFERATRSSSPYMEETRHETASAFSATPVHNVDTSAEQDLPAATSSDGKTSLCKANQSEYSWSNETFSLDTEETHRYLNVRLWFQETNATFSKKDNLTQVGALAVPLHCLQRLCALTTSSTVTRRYKLKSPFCADTELRRTAERFFKQKTGFKLEHCYGDITLAAKLLT